MIHVTKPWPRRWMYPGLGMILALAAPGGLVALRSVMTGRSVSLDWFAGELASQPATHAYMTCGTALALVVLGWILGRKEDLLEFSSTTDSLTGLANRRHLHPLRPEGLYAAADQALYNAKSHGRDRVVLVPGAPFPVVGIARAS